MICTGIIKEFNLFSGIYNSIISKVKNKKIVVALISAISGVLPIPGRNIVSAGLLDTCAGEDPKKRSKFGLINYLATHHWYLWSPIEKTILIPMAALSLTYWQVFQFTFPFLIGYLLYFTWFLTFKIKQEDIQIVKIENGNKMHWLNIVPLLAGIGAVICGFNPWYIFLIIAAIYMLLTKTFNIKKIVSYVDWKLVLLLIGIITVSFYIQTYSANLIEYIKTIQNHFVLTSVVALLISFILGSSAKFAGIVVMLSTIFGLPYFAYFFGIEYIGYLISPTHKCVPIAIKYFNTSIKQFTWIIGGLCLIIFTISLLSLL